MAQPRPWLVSGSAAHVSLVHTAAVLITARLTRLDAKIETGSHVKIEVMLAGSCGATHAADQLQRLSILKPLASIPRPTHGSSICSCSHQQPRILLRYPLPLGCFAPYV